MLLRERLEECLKRFETLRIGVVGDFFLDKYLDTDPGLAELSVETGRVAHQVTHEYVSAGAAGTVVNNLAALDVGAIHVFGAIGDDGHAYELVRCLSSLDCNLDGLIQTRELMTPTYLKPRDQTQKGLEAEHSRYDTKNRGQLSVELSEVIGSSIERSLDQLDALIVVDQIGSDEGAIVTPVLRKRLCQFASKTDHCQFVADSRFHIGEFTNFVLKPNQFEAMGNHHPEPGTVVDRGDVVSAIQNLVLQGNPGAVCTLGGDGALVLEHGDPVHVPAVQMNNPIDPTGAGDSFCATLTAGLAAKATLVEAAIMGILASAITACQLATTGTASRSAVLNQWSTWSKQQETG